MIPKHAKRIFKGIIFDVYQWRQKMFDGGFKTFEAVTRPDTVVIIAESKGKIVTLKQKQPGHSWYYGEPSGRMDVAGESPKQAALRELLEETGLRPEKITLWKKIVPTWKVRHTIYIFIAKNCKKVANQNLDSGEKITVAYLTFDNWLKLSDSPMYIDGSTVVDMLKARIHPEYKAKIKKLIFG